MAKDTREDIEIDYELAEVDKLIKSANLQLIAEIEAAVGNEVFFVGIGKTEFNNGVESAIKDFRTILATKRGEITNG